jgi:hypothetical protein
VTRSLSAYATGSQNASGPLRPHALCKRFPRVGNALAVAWPQAEARAALLKDLLHDGRGRRAGFPPEVRREIEALQRSVS